MAGPIGAALDSALLQNICDADDIHEHRSKFDYAADVKQFCNDYADDKLFDSVPGRCHKAFKDFSSKLPIDNPAKLKGRLIKYCKVIHKSEQCYI